MRVFLLGLLLVVLPPAFAEEVVQMSPTDRGPAIGSMIPSDFSAIDQDGTVRHFEDMTGEKGLVLVFIRSTKWCPFCKRQLIDLISGVDGITSRGYQLAVLSYDSLKDNQRFVEEYEPGYIVLSDRKSEVIDAFEIRNEKYDKFHYAHGVPYPMIFVIGTDKTVQAKFAEEGYKKRPAISVVVEALDGLAEPSVDP